MDTSKLTLDIIVRAVEVARSLTGCDGDVEEEEMMTGGKIRSKKALKRAAKKQVVVQKTKAELLRELATERSKNRELEGRIEGLSLTIANPRAVVVQVKDDVTARLVRLPDQIGGIVSRLGAVEEALVTGCFKSKLNEGDEGCAPKEDDEDGPYKPLTLKQLASATDDQFEEYLNNGGDFRDLPTGEQDEAVAAQMEDGIIVPVEAAVRPATRWIGPVISAITVVGAVAGAVARVLGYW